MPLSKGTEYEQHFLRKLGETASYRQFSECFINMQMLFAAKCNNIFPFSHSHSRFHNVLSCAREEEVEWMMGSELHMFPRVKSWKVLWCWAAATISETRRQAHRTKIQIPQKWMPNSSVSRVVYAFFDVAFFQRTLCCMCVQLTHHARPNVSLRLFLNRFFYNLFDNFKGQEIV